MTRAILITTLVVSATTTLVADQKGQGSKNHKVAKQQAAATDAPGLAVDVHFSIGEERVIREYYAPRYRSLPPGLQKKVARGGQLPPGWQKKLHPFPVEVERRLEPLPPGYSRGVIDGHAVIFNNKTHVLFDVKVLF